MRETLRCGSIKYQEFSVPDTFFGPTVGCMGYGVPSAIGAKLAHPNRVAIAHCGDGGFLMTGQEMATAAQYGINIITVVYNNSALATIRMHQEAQYPNRPSGTDFVNPDFAALGTAYRALGIQVTRDNEFLPALQEALKANQTGADRGHDRAGIYLPHGHLVAGDRRSAGSVRPAPVRHNTGGIIQ